jgi:hypothetical protein
MAISGNMEIRHLKIGDDIVTTAQNVNKSFTLFFLLFLSDL